MIETQPKPERSVLGRLFMLPVNGLWFLIKHPVVALFFILLIAFSSVSFLANFNPAISERFSNAASYFGASTVVSLATEKLRSKNSKLKSKLTKTNVALLDEGARTTSTEIKRKKVLARNLKKKQGLIHAAGNLKKSALSLASAHRSLGGAADSLKAGAKQIGELKAKNQLANSKIDNLEAYKRKNDTKLSTFKQRGANLEITTKNRFAKVALFDSTGEIIGWIPILGDAVSIGLAAGGIYEMCQMFREIESATTELGVPYMVYTDTFCEKPAEKTKQVIADSAGKVKDSVTTNVLVLKDEAAKRSETTIDNVRSLIDQTLSTLKTLI